MARLTHEQVVSGLVARGVPAHIAEGVAQNFRDESGFNTSIFGDSGQAFGLAQWNGQRQNNLRNFAAAHGKAADDPDLQLDFFMHENAGPEREAWNQVLTSRDPQEAAVNFVRFWERPADRHADARAAKYSGASGSAAATYSGQPTNPNVGSTIDFGRAKEASVRGVPAEQVVGSPSAFPDQGGGLYGPAGTAGTEANPLVTQEKKKHPLEAFGKALGDIELGGLKMPAPPPGPETPARADAPAVPPIAPIDPARRQMLAQLMAQLNSGRLFG